MVVIVDDPVDVWDDVIVADPVDDNVVLADEVSVLDCDRLAVDEPLNDAEELPVVDIELVAVKDTVEDPESVADELIEDDCVDE